MSVSTIKRLRLRRPDACAGCGAALAVGDQAGWDKEERVITCLPCLDDNPQQVPASTATDVEEVEPEDDVLQIGDPGASLAREYAKRVAAREKRVRERHPRVGGFLLAVASEPQSTQAFAQGAEGERRVAARLEKACGDQVLFLHNRQCGKSKRSGDIDHLAVAPSGVWVIDAKHYAGAKVDVEVSGGLFGRPRVERLVVRGRDRTSLVKGLVLQQEAVRAALAAYDVNVRGIFCFVGADLPWLRVPQIQGFTVRDTRDTGRQLRADGPLDATLRRMIWEQLARELPPA